MRVSVCSPLCLKSERHFLLASAILFLQFADSQTVVLFRQLPGISGDLLGWCVAASGVGTLIAAMSVRKWKTASHGLKMGLGTAVTGLVIGTAGIVVVVWPAAGIGAQLLLISLFALAGVGIGFAVVPFQILLQEQTPEPMTGRVFGTVGSVMTTSNILGPVAGGLLVTSVWCGACVCKFRHSVDTAGFTVFVEAKSKEWRRFGSQSSGEVCGNRRGVVRWF